MVFIYTTVNNAITGPIPTEFGQLVAMKALNVGNNGLTGSIPIELGNVSGMQYLSLGKRIFTFHCNHYDTTAMILLQSLRYKYDLDIYIYINSISLFLFQQRIEYTEWCNSFGAWEP